MPALDIGAIARWVGMVALALSLLAAVIGLEIALFGWIMSALQNAALEGNPLGFIASGLSLLPNNFWPLVHINGSFWLLVYGLKRFIWLTEQATKMVSG